MTGLAIALVLGAALIHAGWNYLLKKSGGGVGFVWAFAALSAVFYAPLAAVVVYLQHFHFSATVLAFIVASAVLHTAYYLLLDRGYRYGDLSVVYPLARATGPFLTVLVAVALLGERPGIVALCGAALVVGGAFFLAASPAKLREAGAAHGIAFALLTGCMIASYTVVDKQAVSAVLIPPILQDWGANLGRVIVMAPLALRRRGEVKAAWIRQRKAVVLVALLCPLSYILVLTAMVFTPVSYVAPAREISILFAALMGAHWLQEGDVPRRLAAAAAMALGAIALVVLLICVPFGSSLLELFGLSESSLNLAGGVILFLIALRMIFHGPEGIFGETAYGEPFIVPLAIPSIAGPAAIATVLLLVSREPQRLPEWLLAVTVAIAVCLVVLVFAERISRWVGEGVLAAFERLMGLLLTAIAVEMLLRGIEGFVRQLQSG